MDLEILVENVLNAITAAGYRPRGGPSQPFGFFALGVDATIPTRSRLFDRDVFIGMTPIYYFYFNELRFSEFTNESNRLNEQFELAMSLMSHRPWSLKYFDVDRVGISVRTAGEVYGVSIFTSLPF